MIKIIKIYVKGMDGYALFARNKNNMCSIASYVVYPILGTGPNVGMKNLGKRLVLKINFLYIIISMLFIFYIIYNLEN